MSEQPDRQAARADELIEKCAEICEMTALAHEIDLIRLPAATIRAFKGTFILSDEERRLIAETALKAASDVATDGRLCTRADHMQEVCMCIETRKDIADLLESVLAEAAKRGAAK